MIASLFAGSFGYSFIIMNTALLVPPRTIAHRNVSISGCMTVFLHIASRWRGRCPRWTLRGLYRASFTPGANVTATEENVAARLCALDSVADQVAQNGTKTQRVALNRGAGPGRNNAELLHLSRDFVLVSSLLQEGVDAHRR